MFRLALLLGVAILTALPCIVGVAAEPDAVDRLRVNQLQYIGTHNSYHTREKPLTSERGKTLNYTHPPLDVQLDRGVRSFELDLYYKDGAFQVLHIPVIDPGTTCRDLPEALATVRRWSEAHPRHVPISFLFELKKGGVRFDKKIQQIDATALDQLDQVLREGCAEGKIITPDQVRGDAKTLREAVTTTGWPTLGESRGKVFFILHDQDKQRALYNEGHPSLAGRVMFVRSDENRDDAATLVLDGPQSPDIPRLAKQGYFIRTRADSSLRTESPQQPARRDTAFAGGAHIISTDYPTGEMHPETGYLVEFADSAPARVNPVSGPADLRGRAVKE